MKKILSILAVTTTLFTSCTNDDDNSNQIETPATYVFTRDNATTVDFSGQTTRIAMAQEFNAALRVNSNTAGALNGMFAHVEGENDFADAYLNISDKNVRSKVAASTDYFSTNTTVSNAIKADFDNWIADQANNVFVNWNIAATAGSSGQIQQLGGGSIRYVNEKGLELNQAIAKGLIGGLMADQMLNNYLSVSVLDAGSNVVNNNNGVLEDGKNYTSMEHKWDEAYGYLYGAEADPAVPTLQADSFLNSYLRQVDADADFSGLAEEVYEALKLGRAAIVAKKYDVRDAQVQIVRENISKVIAVRGVHYLQAGKTSLAANDYAKAFHELSEGFGFIYSLQFTRKPNTDAPYFTHAEVNAFVDELMEGNGFWDVSSETLDTMSNTIAARFGFTVEAAAN